MSSTPPAMSTLPHTTPPRSEWPAPRDLRCSLTGADVRCMSPLTVAMLWGKNDTLDTHLACAKHASEWFEREMASPSPRIHRILGFAVWPFEP